MKNLTQILAGLMLVFSLLSTAHATSIDISVDQFAVYQSDTPAPEAETETEEGADGEKKKKAGEEEEPDC